MPVFDSLFPEFFIAESQGRVATPREREVSGSFASNYLSSGAFQSSKRTVLLWRPAAIQTFWFMRRTIGW